MDEGKGGHTSRFREGCDSKIGIKKFETTCTEEEENNFGVDASKKKKKREKKRSMSVEKKGGMIELKVRFMRKENGNYEEVVEKERERREDS